MHSTRRIDQLYARPSCVGIFACLKGIRLLMFLQASVMGAVKDTYGRKAGATKAPASPIQTILFTATIRKNQRMLPPALLSRYRPRLFPAAFVETFIFTFPSPFFATVVVRVARLITLFQAFSIAVMTMTGAIMLHCRLRRLCDSGFHGTR